MIQLKGMYRIPHWKDPRWTLLAFLLTYALLAIGSPTFTRTPAQFLASVISCVGVDMLMITLYKRVRLFPLSGMIASMGTFLLTDSPEIWPYAMVGTLSMLGKHLITVNGRHVFNPNNFGVVLAVLFFSSDIMSEAGRWGGNWKSAVFITVFGLFAVYRANSIILSLSYFFAFILALFIRAVKLGAFVFGETSLTNGAWIFGVFAPTTGAGFYLFVFYMISDPATTPRTARGQILFGIALGFLDGILRYNQQKYAPFISLFILCAIYSAIRAAPKPQSQPVPIPVRAH